MNKKWATNPQWRELGEILRALCFTRIYQAQFESRLDDCLLNVNPFTWAKYLWWSQVRSINMN